MRYLLSEVQVSQSLLYFRGFSFLVRAVAEPKDLDLNVASTVVCYCEWSSNFRQALNCSLPKICRRSPGLAVLIC